MAGALDSADRRDAAGPGATDDVSLIAHRGFAGLYPENTLAAFRGAVRSSPAAPAMVEVDVAPSADGDVFVFHDEDLARLTDAPTDFADRPIWETPTETLRDLEVLGSGQGIPLLSEVLAVVPDGVGVNIEFKNPGTADVRPGELLDLETLDRQTAVWREFAERTLDVAAEHGHDLLVSSFSEAALAAVREVDPDVPLAAVFAESIADGFEVARRHDCEFVHAPWNMVLGTPLFNAEYEELGPYEEIDVVDVAHAEGRKVNVWTVGTWYQANQLRKAGVDGLIADYPHLHGYAPPDDAATVGE